MSYAHRQREKSRQRDPRKKNRKQPKRRNKVSLKRSRVSLPVRVAKKRGPCAKCDRARTDRHRGALCASCFRRRNATTRVVRFIRKAAA